MSSPVHPLPEIEDILQHNPGWRDETIDTPSVSRLTSVPVCTAATFHCRGDGPPFLKLGTAVRYRRRTVLRWLAECEKAQNEPKQPPQRPANKASIHPSHRVG